VSGRRRARATLPSVGPAILLAPLAPLYRAASRLRAAGYRRGVFASERLPVPVVSVGNLTFGGTGKTPAVAALARDLVRRGRRPAVLTRGYGRRSGEPLLLVGPEPRAGVDEAGDEPLELAGMLPGVPVVVDADRVRGGLRARAAGADVVILDDGFQHLRLERDLDLVLVDAGDPWGGGWRLREPLSALRRASAVLVTRLSPADPEAGLEPIRRRVGRIAPGVPVLGATVRPTAVRTVEGRQDPETLDGVRVFAFAGIGRPGGFLETLRSLGAEVVEVRWFGDHHRYTAAEFEAILARARRLEALPVTTGKDAVKLPEDAPVAVLETATVPVEGNWDRLWAVAPEVLR